MEQGHALNLDNLTCCERMNRNFVDRFVLTERNPMLYGKIQAEARDTVRLTATIDWHPADGANLLLIVDGEELTEELAKEAGFIKTHTGFYQYLRAGISGTRLRYEFSVVPEMRIFRLRLWGSHSAPVVLEDLRFDSTISKWAFVHPQPRQVIRKWERLNEENEPPIFANLLIRKSGCGPHCIVHCNPWFETRNEIGAAANPSGGGRDDVYLEADSGEMLPATLLRPRMVMLELPESIEAYLDALGRASRGKFDTMILPAHDFREIDPGDHIEAIGALQSSGAIQRGDSSSPVPSPPRSSETAETGCALHAYRSFALFKDDRLVSFATLSCLGELAYFRYLACEHESMHHDALRLLIVRIVEALIAAGSGVRYVDGSFAGVADDGIEACFEGAGFRSRYLVTYDSAMMLYRAQAPDGGDARNDGEPAEDTGSRKKGKARLYLSDTPFIHETVTGDVMQAIEARIGRRVVRLPAPGYLDLVDYLSGGLSELVIEWMQGTCFAIPFPDRIPEDGDEISRHLLARFKQSPMTAGGFRIGFKGGDFRARGYFQVSDDQSLFFRGLLVVEKVTGIGESRVRALSSRHRDGGTGSAAVEAEPPVFVADDVFIASIASPCRLDRIRLVAEYEPLPDGWTTDNTVRMSLLYSPVVVDIDMNTRFTWDSELPNSSVRMWYYSLFFLGRLLATADKFDNPAAYRVACRLMSDFLDYMDIAEHRRMVGKISSADHSAAERLKVMLAFHQCLTAAGDEHDIELKARLEKEIHRTAEWLTDEANLGVGNHQLMGCLSLIFAYAITRDDVANIYLETAWRRIGDLAGEAFDKDGLCNENTIGYHNFNLSLYISLAATLRSLQISSELLGKVEQLIERATHALRLCVLPNGMIPPIGDSPRYMSKVESDNRSFCFFDSGFAVVKRDDFYFSLICGARTNWHKHMDDTSIYLQYKGVDVFIDGGSYSYDQMNPYTRCITSSAGHTGIFLTQFDGLPRYDLIAKYGPVHGAIDRFEESEDGVRIECHYSVPGCWTSVRRWIFVGSEDEVVLVDEVKTPNLADAVQRFVLAPDIKPESRDGAIVLKNGDFAGVMTHSAASTEIYRGEMDGKVRGWSTYTFGEISPTTGIDLYGPTHEGRFTTFIKMGSENADTLSRSARRFADGTDGFFSR